MDRERRVVSPKKKKDDHGLDRGLRPKTLNEYVGQKKSKEKLDYEPKISIEEGIERFIGWYNGYHGI